MLEEKTSVHSNNIRKQAHAHEKINVSPFFKPAIQPSLTGNQPDIQREAKPVNEFKDCKNELSLLAPLVDDAKNNVNTATRVIATSWGRPDKISSYHKQLLMDHFHTTDRGDLRDILGKYVSLGKGFEAGLKLQCDTTCPKSSAGPWCGYANKSQWFGGSGPIHICFDKKGCDYSTLPPDIQKSVIIHEAAHRFTGVDDKAYAWQPDYQTQSSEDAMNNADSYATFAMLA